MSEYTPIYQKPYTEGFVNAPPYKTPITAEIMDAYDNAIKCIENYLQENPIQSGAGNSIDLSNGTVEAVLKTMTAKSSISMGRKEGTQTGFASVAAGSSVTASGWAAHAEGEDAQALGQASHAEGSGVKAEKSYSHAEGRYTQAKSTAAHAEGFSTKAEGNYAHAEGYYTIASGENSHTEGYETKAQSSCSHAEGSYTIASGQYAHAEGRSTAASGESQHVQGRYNIEDTEGKYAHIVGNGQQEEHANAHTLDWEGNAWFAGTLECSGLVLTDTADSTKRYLVQITGGQLAVSDITEEAV